MLVISKEGASPVLLEMPHSGVHGIKNRVGIPDWFDLLVRHESAEVRKTLGFGVDAAAPILSGYDRLLATMPVSGVRTRLARALVDCNRERTEVSGLAVIGADERQHHHGVIWARTVVTGVSAETLRDERQLTETVNTKSEPVLRRPLTRREFVELLRWGYRPYHETIAAHHDRLTALHGKCVHLALHTLPAFAVATCQGGYVCGPPATRGPLDPDTGTLPDVILIHNGFAAADRRFVDAVRKAFTDAGLIVSDGSGPFLGSNGVTAMYGDPENGIHVIGIEHVTHDGIEPRRHEGDTAVANRKAVAFQSVYRQAVTNVLNET